MGIDEAGRGPLAVPVVVCACILPDRFSLKGIRDSKQLSDLARRQAASYLRSNPKVCYALCFIDVDTIDTINILQATLLGMEKAYGTLGIACDLALVDGNVAPKLPIKTETIVKGDDKIPSISAASILAKVARDDFMIALDEVYPQYRFCNNKGYATKEHLEALACFGAIPQVHRRSFTPVALSSIAVP